MLFALAQTAAATTLVTATAPTTAPGAHGFPFYALLSGLYGIIEGLTEFLPVSSTAHLRIAQDFTGINLNSGYWKMYSVVIQLGAILTVPLLFKDRILGLWHNFPRGEDGKKTIWTHPLSLTLIGFLVTAGPCYLAEKYIGKSLENLLVIGVALLAGGIVMWVVDAFCTRPRAERMEEMTILDAVWIGLVQIVSAIFPGTSRSMATIAGGQVVGLSRSTALVYSFFLSIPTMLAATMYKLLQALVHHKTPEEVVNYNAPPQQWIILVIGFGMSFLVAWFVNKGFIIWVRKHGFAPFAIYRIVLGLGLLFWLLTGEPEAPQFPGIHPAPTTEQTTVGTGPG